MNTTEKISKIKRILDSGLENIDLTSKEDYDIIVDALKSRLNQLEVKNLMQTIEAEFENKKSQTEQKGA